MDLNPETEMLDRSQPEERANYRMWYAGFETAARSDRPVEHAEMFREWYAHFDAGKWDRQFENDVSAGRLDWLAAEARSDLREGRCTDR